VVVDVVVVDVVVVGLVVVVVDVVVVGLVVVVVDVVVVGLVVDVVVVGLVVVVVDVVVVVVVVGGLMQYAVPSACPEQVAKPPGPGQIPQVSAGWQQRVRGGSHPAVVLPEQLFQGWGLGFNGCVARLGSSLQSA
jgi:hypothetical protein